jgi:hypothetical protein
MKLWVPIAWANFKLNVDLCFSKEELFNNVKETRNFEITRPAVSITFCFNFYQHVFGWELRVDKMVSINLIVNENSTFIKDKAKIHKFVDQLYRIIMNATLITNNVRNKRSWNSNEFLFICSFILFIHRFINSFKEYSLDLEGNNHEGGFI